MPAPYFLPHQSAPDNLVPPHPGEPAASLDRVVDGRSCQCEPRAMRYFREARLSASAFVVAIGGKADIAFCGAHVRF